MLLIEEKDDLLNNVLQLGNENQILVDEIKELKRLNRDLESMEDTEKPYLKNKMIKLKEDIKSKAQSNLALLHEINNAKKEILEFNNEKIALKSEIHYLKKNVSLDDDSLKEENKLLEEKLDSLRSKLADKRIKIKKLKDEIESHTENSCVAIKESTAKSAPKVIQNEIQNKSLIDKISKFLNTFERKCYI